MTIERITPASREEWLAAQTRIKDISAGGINPGDKFSEYTAIEPTRVLRKSGKWAWFWRCRCSCGNERSIPVGNLKSGNSKSCGCKKAERISVARTKHGEGRHGRTSREYRSWTGMIKRCTNQSDPKFPIYGGRGISVCDKWRHDYSAFLADMGRCKIGMSLDRINVDGNYEPSNCRWATAQQQAENRRVVRVSKEKVVAIRSDQRPNKVIAAEIGVTAGHIADIKGGRAWSHVD